MDLFILIIVWHREQNTAYERQSKNELSGEEEKNVSRNNIFGVYRVYCRNRFTWLGWWTRTRHMFWRLLLLFCHWISVDGSHTHRILSFASLLPSFSSAPSWQFHFMHEFGLNSCIYWHNSKYVILAHEKNLPSILMRLIFVIFTLRTVWSPAFYPIPWNLLLLFPISSMLFLFIIFNSLESLNKQ